MTATVSSANGKGSHVVVDVDWLPKKPISYLAAVVMWLGRDRVLHLREALDHLARPTQTFAH